MLDTALALLHLLAGAHGANRTYSHDSSITQVSLVFRLVDNRTEPGLFFAQPCQVFKDSLACLVASAQTHIDVIAQVVTKYTRLGFFNVGERLIFISAFQGQDNGMLVDVALILEEACTLIHYEAALYIVDALYSLVVVTSGRLQIATTLSNLAQQIVTTVLQVEQALALSDIKRLVTEILRGSDISHGDGNTSLEERGTRHVRQRFLFGSRIGDLTGLALSILQMTIREVEFSPLQPRSSSKGYTTTLFQEITGFLQHRLSFAKMAFEHSCLRLVHQGVREVMVMSLELAEKGYCLGSKFIRLAGTIEADQAEADL